MDKQDKFKAVVSPESPSRGRVKVSKKTLALVGVVIVCLLVGGLFYVRHKNEQKRLRNITADPTKPAPISKYVKPTDEFSTTITAADKLSATSKYQEAITSLEKLALKTKKPMEVYAIASRLGMLYDRINDWPNAIKWYKSAIDTNQPGALNLYLNLALIYEKSGEKQQAVDAYKKLIEPLKSQKDTVSKAAVVRYETKISELGGS